MKKLVLAALAIGAMAACTKSNVQLEQPGEIAFQPVAQKATKAAVDGTVYPVDESFNVWAWWDDVAPSANPTYANYTAKYIDAGKFIARDNFNWGGETPYYWPTSGSLVFAGYSPANAAGTLIIFLMTQLSKLKVILSLQMFHKLRTLCGLMLKNLI